MKYFTISSMGATRRKSRAMRRKLRLATIFPDTSPTLKMWGAMAPDHMVLKKPTGTQMIMPRRKTFSTCLRSAASGRNQAQTTAR